MNPSWCVWIAKPCCLRLFEHCIRRAASRAACTAGNNNPTSIPIMAMTTKSSTNVNPFWFERTENLCLTIRTDPLRKTNDKNDLSIHINE